ncbi:hypothetical protein HR45_04775 [Shewanella mangrovi]|uniref:AB hydrolase-1 domain-containing protein n=1 Tax=Shewanella mangrovi TaxID=1515746 RepID=A0A094LU59_9GAMM|nr:hypothetical protein HR45_04775 [Shewanella mangrovi]
MCKKGSCYRVVIKKFLFGTLVIAAIYYLMAVVVLHYFLSALIFIKVPSSNTHETQRYVVATDGVESLIRAYIAPAQTGCVLFFPGQHGDIARYENDVFAHLSRRGISVYAISYPGYEGAKGTANFANVKAVTQHAVSYIEQHSACRIADSVFIGRSLGAAIAIENALNNKPRGLLLDGVSPSLAATVRQKLKGNIWLKPLQLLPIAQLLAYNPKLTDQLRRLAGVAVVIFQGDRDALTPLQPLQRAVSDESLLELVVIKGGTHRDTQVTAGPLYFDKLCQIISCVTPKI